ncbi:MAG: hypothetical protein ABSB75_02670 [Candidatus Limnocylindrales bacterium]
MFTSADELFLHCRLRGSAGTAIQFVREARRFLLALAELQPELQRVTVPAGSRRGTKVVVSPADDTFEKEVLPALYFSKDIYEDLGPKRTILPHTRSQWGFFLVAYSGRRTVDAMEVTLSGLASIRATYADLHIDFRPGGDPATRSPEFMELVFRRSIEYWHPLGGEATASRLHGFASAATYFSVGWLTYLTDPRVPDALPPGTHYERFVDGVLIRLNGETFLRDKAQVAEAIRIRDALSAAGLLAMPPIPRPGEAQGE